MGQRDAVRSKRNPEVGQISFGRNSSVSFHDGVLWTAVHKEENGKVSIVVYRNDGKETVSKVIERSGEPYSPKIISSDNKLLLVWSEVADSIWDIYFCEINPESFEIGSLEKVFSSTELLDSPTMTIHDGISYIVWSERKSANIQINAAHKNDGEWQVFGPLSKKGVDAFRPDITASSMGVFVAYDRYRNNTYEVAFGKINNLKYEELEVFSDKNKRQLTPKIISSNDAVYTIWVALTEVEDNKGVCDHAAHAYSAMYKNGSVRMLTDPGNKEDTNITVDLREGLLAHNSYCGFYGLRRNPYLSLDDSGNLWCFWEVMIEDDYKPKDGHLIGRKLGENNKWEESYEIFSGVYSYAVPERMMKEIVPVAYIDCTKKRLEIQGNTFVSLIQNKQYFVDSDKWRRWCPSSPTKLEKNRQKTILDGKEYTMYWADTHCHSNVSPDAEGEPDELIHFARDIAGLDAVCLLDNDYYPFKALTIQEWKRHGELAARYTKEDEFVVFSGWEFTYHRSDLLNDMNHRTVMYPRAGGKLFRRHDPESDTDKKLLEKLEKTCAIVYPHHVTYEIINPEIDRNVEITSSWRICMAECDFTIKQLLAGKKFGFIGSSDSHRANPGMGCAWTGIYAEALTPESLAEAYRARRLVATQGFPIYIDFRVAGTFIGQETVASMSKIDIIVDIKASEKMERVRLIRDGECLHKYSPGSRELKVNLSDQPEKGEHFYFLEVKLFGNPGYNINPKLNSYATFASKDGEFPHNLCPARGVFAWTSPVWISIKK